MCRPPTVNETINLGDYTDTQLRDLVREHKKNIQFKDKTLLEQILIVLRHKGVSITAAVTILFGGVYWQGENVIEMFVPGSTLSEIEIMDQASNLNRLNILLDDMNRRLGRHTDRSYHRGAGARLEKNSDSIIQQQMVAIVHVQRLDAIIKQTDLIENKIEDLTQSIIGFERLFTEISSRQAEQIKHLQK